LERAGGEQVGLRGIGARLEGALEMADGVIEASELEEDAAGFEVGVEVGWIALERFLKGLE
jgi:hypothetical protein